MIKVLHNFAGEEFCERVMGIINSNIPFAYRSGTMWPGYMPPGEDAYDSPQMVHPIHAEGPTNSPLAWAVDRLCGMLTAKEGVYTERIHRSKVNINMPAPHIPPRGHYPPHRDMEGTAHMVALYYPMDSDGDTLFFIEGLDGQLLEFQRVTPKADTLVCFEGDILHAAQPPRKNATRFSINITLINKGETPWPTPSLT
jgi:hypothetical protein